MVVLCSVLALTHACGDDDAGGDDSGGGASGDGSSAPAASPCTMGCEATLAAECDNGPPDAAGCEADCEAHRVGACATEYGAVIDCAEGEPVTCDDSGLPTVEACDAELSAFVACLNS